MQLVEGGKVVEKRNCRTMDRSCLQESPRHVVSLRPIRVLCTISVAAFLDAEIIPDVHSSGSPS